MKTPYRLLVVFFLMTANLSIHPMMPRLSKATALSLKYGSVRNMGGWEVLAAAAIILGPICCGLKADFIFDGTFEEAKSYRLHSKKSYQKELMRRSKLQNTKSIEDSELLKKEEKINLWLYDFNRCDEMSRDMPSSLKTSAIIATSSLPSWYFDCPELFGLALGASYGSAVKSYYKSRCAAEKFKNVKNKIDLEMLKKY